VDALHVRHLFTDHLVAVGVLAGALLQLEAVDGTEATVAAGTVDVLVVHGGELAARLVVGVLEVVEHPIA